MNTYKKTLVLILSLLMVFALAPQTSLAAYAAEVDGPDAFAANAAEGEVTGIVMQTNGILVWDPYEGASEYTMSVNRQASVVGSMTSYEVYNFIDEMISLNNIDIPEDNNYHIYVLALDDKEQTIAEGSIVTNYDYKTGAGSFRFIYGPWGGDLTWKGDLAKRIAVDINHEYSFEVDPAEGNVDWETLIDDAISKGLLRRSTGSYFYNVWAYAYDGDGKLVDDTDRFEYCRVYCDSESEYPERQEIRLDLEQVSGHLTWTPVEGAVKYRLYSPHISDIALKEFSSVPEYEDVSVYHREKVESGTAGSYYMVEVTALNEDGVIIGSGSTNYYPGAILIEGTYEKAEPLVINYSRDCPKGYYEGDTYVGYPTDGDKITLTFLQEPEGSENRTKVYVYDSEEEYFINANDPTDKIYRYSTRWDITAPSYNWDVNGNDNFYYCYLMIHDSDGDLYPDIPVKVPVELTTSPVQSIDYYPFPRLIKDKYASRSSWTLDKDKVVVHYKDGTDETFVYDIEERNYKSLKTGEYMAENDDDDYYNIVNGYDPETNTDYVEYMGVRAEVVGATYIAQQFEYKPAEAVRTLIKNVDSYKKTDASGNEYDYYYISNSNLFQEGDQITVTYRNSLGEEVVLDYPYSESGGFELPETCTEYYTGLPDSRFPYRYFKMEWPDQAVDQLVPGNTYEFSMYYQEMANYAPIPNAGQPYTVEIKAYTADDITEIYFAYDGAQMVAKGDYALFKNILRWEPGYADEPELTWESSDPSVATVDENGKVTAVLTANDTDPSIENGFATITAKFGNLTASKDVHVYVRHEITTENTTLGDVEYTGQYISSLPILYNGEPLDKAYYSATWATVTNIGDESTVGIMGRTPYSGSISIDFKVVGNLGKDVTQVTTEPAELGAFTYTGEAIEPAIESVTAMGRGGEIATLEEGKDYTIEYVDNVDRGTGYVRIKAVAGSDYVGYKDVPFTIGEAEKSAQAITAKAAASSVAVGKTTTIKVTGAEGEVSYKSADTTIATVTAAGKVTAKKVGTVKITVTAAETDQFKKATKTVTIKVVPAATSSVTAENLATGMKISWKKVTGATGYKVYRDSTLVKEITSGSTVTYTDKKANTNGTKYVFKVVATAGTGDSTLSKSVTTYRVSKPAISSLTNSAAKKMTVKWAKNAKATGYEIMYSTSKSFASGNKTVTVTKNSTVSKAISSLTKGKTYYVKMRTYKTVSGKKYWSAWSAVKNVKISK